MKQLALGVKLRDDAVFANFSAGANTEAVAALQDRGVRLIWLWGAAGSGKTHLLQAVCAAAGAAAGYFPLGRSSRLPPEALQGFETARTLCLDDVDAVAGEVAWERALFRLFNDSVELDTRLIFAASAAPRSLAWSLEDWGSRSAACVVYQVKELDEGGRIEVLRRRAAQRGLDLPPETVDYLLARMPRDLTSLLQVLDELDDASLAAQRPLTVPFIRDALERSAKTRP